MKNIILSLFLLVFISPLFSQSANNVSLKQKYDSICVRNDILLDQIDISSLSKYDGAAIDIHKKGNKYFIDIHYMKPQGIWHIKGRKIRGVISYNGYDIALYMPFENPFFAPIRVMKYGHDATNVPVVVTTKDRGEKIRNNPKKYIYRNGELFEFVE